MATTKSKPVFTRDEVAILDWAIAQAAVHPPCECWSKIHA